MSSGSIACGIAGQWVLLTAIGPGADTDAYFAALVLPQVLLAVVAGPLLNVLVPLLSTVDAAERRRTGWLLVAVLGSASALATLILALLAPTWVPLTIPGFAEPQLALTVMLVRLQMLASALSVIALVLSAAAQSAGRFVRVESATLAGSMLGLGLTIVLVPGMGVVAAAWAGIARVIVQGAIIVPLLGLPRRGHGAWELARRAWSGMKPLIVSGALAKTDPLIDRVLLSLAPGGMLSLFQLAQGLFAAAIEVVNRSWIAPALPALARDATGDPAAYRSRLRRLLVMTAVALFVAIAVLIVAGQELLRFVLEYGHVSADDITQLWWTLLGLSGVLVGASIGQIGASGFYARGDTATPARLAMVSFACFAPLKVAAFYGFGVAGLVGACSGYYLTNALALLWLLRRDTRRVT